MIMNVNKEINEPLTNPPYMAIASLVSTRIGVVGGKTKPFQYKKESEIIKRDIRTLEEYTCLQVK